MKYKKKNYYICFFNSYCNFNFLFCKKIIIKKFNIGNNITSKSIKEVENYILNINSYKAKIEVEVQSNKNENKYILMQKFAKPNISKQEVLEPSDVKRN